MAVAAPVVAAGAGAAGGSSGAAAGAGGAGAAGGASKAGSGAGGLKPQQALKRAGQGGGGEEQEERRRRRVRLTAAVAFPLAIVLLFCVVLLSVFVTAKSEAMQGFGTPYPTGSGIPPVYWPMYVSAGGYYKVSPYLLASIHYQETTFSTAQSTKGGFNSNGCCAGPMQFNVKGGTWAEYENAFRPIEEERPVAFYPSDRRRLPSCQSIPVTVGCVYDDFDAIAAAADLLHKKHADTSLYSAGTREAVCSYIGSCSEVDSCTGSENQYCEVIPRAVKWEALGREAEAKAVAQLGSVAGGPVREQIVKIAVEQLGVHEGPGNRNPYGPSDSWCAMFSTWVWERAGIHIRTAMSHDGLNPFWVPDLEKYAKRHGLWRTNPEPGDMVIFSGHVGLVKELKGGGRITEIGGNQSDAVTELAGTPAGLGVPSFHGFMTVPEVVSA
jgi:CHAP domain-containing protein